nr:cytochrome P450 [Tanacetum cinerariifolium]
MSRGDIDIHEMYNGLGKTILDVIFYEKRNESVYWTLLLELQRLQVFSKTFNDSKLFSRTLNTSKLFSGTFWKRRVLKLQALDRKDKENKGNETMASSSNMTNSELGLHNVLNTLGDNMKKVNDGLIKPRYALIVVDIPKFEGEGYTRSTIRNLKILRQAARGPPVGLEPKSNFVCRPVQPTNKTSGKKKQVGFIRQEVSNSNPFDVLSMMENDDDLGVNGENSKLAETVADAGMVSSAHGSSLVASGSLSTTLLAKNFNKLERQMLDRKLMLVEDNGKLIDKVDFVPVNSDNDSDVEVAYDETAQFMASRSANDASLYEDKNYDAQRVHFSTYHRYISKTNFNKGSSEMVMVDMKEWLENFILDMVLRMLFGSPISSENADQFKNAIKQFLELLGAFVPSDIVPCLKWFDLGGYEKKMKKTSREIDVIVDEWLQVHKKKMKFTPQVDGSKDQVFMATLLSRVKEELKHDLHSFSVDAIVKSTCLAIFAAASHTTTKNVRGNVLCS